MQFQLKKEKWIFIFGLIGIIGALTTIASDVILIGIPGKGSVFFTFGTEIMADISNARISVGTFLGVFSLPLQIAGLVPIYYGLKSANEIMAMITVSIFSHALMVGVAFHGAYAYIAGAWKLDHSISTNNPLIQDMMGKFDFYWRLVGSVILFELFIGSILFIIIVLGKKTLFPRWIILFNPFFITIFFCFVVYNLPGSLGGYIAPIFANLSTLLCFIIPTIIAYRNIKKLF